MSQNTVLTMNTRSSKLFFGEEGHGICRYDIVRYPEIGKLDAKMRKFYWQPNLIDMSGEQRSFQQMTEPEQFVFTSNLKRQIILDTEQGRGPALAFLPHVTDSTLENAVLAWSFFESIHSESYTHIIRSIYPDPEAVVDDIPNIKPIVDCAKSISLAYDNLISSPSKETLYLGLISANALEAIRFYVSFACTFSFHKRGSVTGSGNIVKLIARDENLHLALVQHILKALPKDDPEFDIIIKDNRAKAAQIFYEAAEQEKEWATYLFSHGPILGLSESILHTYVDYLLYRRMRAAGVSDGNGPRIEDPLPWMKQYLSSADVQEAPQEMEKTSYLSSAINNNIGEVSFAELLKI